MPPKKLSSTKLIKMRAENKKAEQEKKVLNEIEEANKLLKNQYYSLRHVLSYDYMMYFFLLGAREAGKSYAVTKYFVSQYKKHGIPFIWIRLTDTQADALLKNNAERLVDADIRRKYNLDLVVSGNHVYETKHEWVTVTSKDGSTHEERREVRSERKLFATVYCASTFYNDKGSIYDKDFLNDPKMKYHIGIDEFEREKGEKNTFDIKYSVVNQLENIIRAESDRVKIFFIGNTLEEASDILCQLNFIPEQDGIFKLVRNKKKLMQYIKELRQCKNAEERFLVNYRYKDVDFGKRALIENIQITEAYKIRRKNGVANTLLPDASTFTNKIKTDNALVCKEPLQKPNYIIKFTKEPSTWFTVWNRNIINAYNKEKKMAIPMRPYLDEVYTVDSVKEIIAMFDTRCFLFHNLITFKKFQNQLALLKPRKG